MHHARDLETFVGLQLNFWPNVERGRKGERRTGLVVELGNLWGSGRNEAGFARGFFEKGRQHIANNFAANRIAIARYDNAQRHLTLAKAGNFYALLVGAIGAIELFVHALSIDLNFQFAAPLTLLYDVGLHVLQPCKNCETESARRPTEADGAAPNGCVIMVRKGGLEPPRPLGH